MCLLMTFVVKISLYWCPALFCHHSLRLCHIQEIIHDLRGLGAQGRTRLGVAVKDTPVASYSTPIVFINLSFHSFLIFLVSLSFLSRPLMTILHVYNMKNTDPSLFHSFRYCDTPKIHPFISTAFVFNINTQCCIIVLVARYLPIPSNE